MLHILYFKHCLFFFSQSFQGVWAFPILRFSHMRRLFHRALGLFFFWGLRSLFLSPGSAYPRAAEMSGQDWAVSLSLLLTH